MKTLNEIKNELANQFGYVDWSQFQRAYTCFPQQYHDMVAMLYAEQAIDAAAEQAELTNQPTFEQIQNCMTIEDGYGESYGVDKQSILKIKEELK